MYIVYVILITTSLDKWDVVIGVRPVVFVFLHIFNLYLDTYNWCHQFNGGKKYVIVIEVGRTDLCLWKLCRFSFLPSCKVTTLSFDLRGLSWPTFTLITTRTLTHFNFNQQSDHTSHVENSLNIFNIYSLCYITGKL